MADCTATYEYVDPHGTYTGILACDGVDHKHGLHSGRIGDGYRHVWPMREAVEWCRETDSTGERCGAPADLVIWGRLFPPEALGPHCLHHAGKYIDTSEHMLSQSAVFDLRGVARVGAYDELRAEIEQLRAQVADAWDQGHDAGRRGYGKGCTCGGNPYRAASKEARSCR